MFSDSFFNFYWKGDLQKERELLTSTHWFTPPMAIRAMSFFWDSYIGTGSQGFWPSSTDFPGHQQGSEWEVEQPGHEPVPTWDLGTCSQRISQLSHWPALYFNYCSCLFETQFCLSFSCFNTIYCKHIYTTYFICNFITNFIYKGSKKAHIRNLSWPQNLKINTS